MCPKCNINGFFKLMYKDRKLFFILLASLLISISIFTQIAIHFSTYSLEKSLIVGITYSFAWVVVAWILTDKSVLRKPYPYLLIFFSLILKDILGPILWSIFDIKIFFTELFLLVEFIVIFIVFLTIWYLARPYDFKKFRKENNFIKRFIGIILASFTIILPYILVTIFSYKSLIDFFGNTFYEIYDLIFTGIPTAISFLIFAIIITNIKTNSKNYVYLLIIFFSILPTIPYLYYILPSPISMELYRIFYLILVFISNFFVFTCLLLVSKEKYLE